MQNISLFKKNILQFIDFKGIKKSEFYRQTGITRGVLDHTTGLTEDNLTKFIATYPEVNTKWLLTGNGKMLLSEDKVSVNSLPIVTDIVENYGEKYCKFNVFDFSTAAAAGEAIILNEIDKTKAEPNIFLPALGPGINIRVPVKGDSMYSTIKDGDKVVATLLHNPKDDIRSGYVYVIVDREDGVIIKRLYKDGGSYVEVVSDNDMYKPYKRKLSDFIAIFKAKEVHSSDLRNYYDDVRKDVRELQIAVKELQHKLNG